MHWQQRSSDLCQNNEHVHLEIGAPSLDAGNITMAVDIAVTHLDSKGPRSGEFLPFLMTDKRSIGGFILLSTSTANTDQYWLLRSLLLNN